ncbi:NUDIX hydrolase [Kribbella sp. NPDC049174]|uniref:NUDIX hydrolase n=1 Tax=Kribbella sp. NPDC049174 TaxID=3364112 RepID=UPI00371919C8
MSFRLAAYAVCVEDGRVLVARHVSAKGESTWTFPGGRVEHEEDPFDAVIREVAEETGCDAVVERLLGVDSRLIPSAGRTVAPVIAGRHRSRAGSDDSPYRPRPSRPGRRSDPALRCLPQAID